MLHASVNGKNGTEAIAKGRKKKESKQWPKEERMEGCG
jgi:hypothetical protein